MILLIFQESTEPCMVEGGPYGGVYDGLVCAGHGTCRYVEMMEVLWLDIKTLLWILSVESSIQVCLFRMNFQNSHPCIVKGHFGPFRLHCACKTVQGPVCQC